MNNIRNFVIIAHIDRRELLRDNSLPNNLSVFSIFLHMGTSVPLTPLTVNMGTMET